MTESLTGYPYVEARLKNTKKRPTTIELHISQTTSDKGAALAIALHQHRNPIPQYDFTVDNESVIECTQVLGRTIKVLICAEPHEREPLWEDAVAKPVLYKCAYLLAELSDIYRIPAKYVDRESRWRHRGGILVNVVGTWPYESFLHNVRSNIKTL